MLFKKKGNVTVDIAELENTPEEAEINPAETQNNERVNKLENMVNQVVEVLNMLTQQKNEVPEVVEPQAPTNNFIEQLAEYGEDAILSNSKIMKAIQTQLQGYNEYNMAKAELANQYPEVLKDSEVGKTKETIRNQMQQLGVHESVMNSRFMEELVTKASIGHHFDTLSAKPKPGFVESASRNGVSGVLDKNQLSQDQKNIADKFGIKEEEYSKYQQELVNSGIMN